MIRKNLEEEIEGIVSVQRFYAVAYAISQLFPHKKNWSK